MAKPEQRRPFVPILWLAAFVVIVVLVFVIRSMTRADIRVRTARVTFQTLSSTISTNGKVEPVQEFQAHAPAAGVVKDILVDEGQQVASGTLLVKVDDTDARARLATAQATLTQAELQSADLQAGGTTEERGTFSANVNSAGLEQKAAQSNLALEESLQKKGSASASEVAAAQQRLHSADFALENAKGHAAGDKRYGALDRANAQARIADARAAIQSAQKSITDANIRSPYTGTVYSIPVSKYDFVQVGEDLMDVADLNRILVRAYFDEPEIGKLADGQPVRITWDAKPNQSWHGHIEHAPTTVITYGTRNVGECLITVDDARGDLLPNTNVIVTVTEAQRTDVLSIPRESLHTDGGHNFVYRIIGRKLQQTAVQLGQLVTLTDVEIAGGLHANDIIVLGPATAGVELTNGLAVSPVK